MNKFKLKSFMALHGDTLEKLSEQLGITPQRLSAKINEYKGAEFTQSEIGVIKNRYGLSAEEIEEIFFEQKVS